MMKKASEWASKFGASLKSVAKLASQSRHASICNVIADTSRPIIIMGNGPSLSATIAEHADKLCDGPAMAVNFAAISPEFIQLKPKYYILVDPHFFSDIDDDNLRHLWMCIAATAWPMTLIVPRTELGRVPIAVAKNPNICVVTINPVGIEGWQWLEDMAYKRGLGMPRPRNVLIPAIMSALQMGYKEIYIVGADHSWLKTLEVDGENHVVSRQPHFYKEDEKEITRINTEYMNYPLHQILESFYVAFKSYHSIERFARSIGVKIYNATPESYIDAFERRSL